MRIFAYDRFKPGVTLETIEPDVRALEPLDGALHRRIAAQLDELQAPLRRMAVDVESLGGSRSQEQRLRQRELELHQAGYLLGILASGGLLAVMLRLTR